MEIWQQIFSQKIGQMKPGDRWTLKVDYYLQSNDLDPGWKQFLQQHAFARFECSQCWHTWHSAQVNILFHMDLDRKQRQGQVKMKIFRQECKKCLVPKLELPEFSQENVERVLENLMLKIRGKCYREAINPHDLCKIIVEAQTMGPHDSSHCEACRLGICCMKYEAQAPASTFFRPASLLPRIFPAQEEWSEAETGSGRDSGSSHDSGSGRDSGSSHDSGSGLDSGSSHDSGSGLDSGSGRDSGSSCDRRRCCCYSTATIFLVIFLAVLIFVLLYFKTK